MQYDQVEELLKILRTMLKYIKVGILYETKFPDLADKLAHERQDEVEVSESGGMQNKPIDESFQRTLERSYKYFSNILQSMQNSPDSAQALLSGKQVKVEGDSGQQNYLSILQTIFDYLLTRILFRINPVWAAIDLRDAESDKHVTPKLKAKL